MSDRRLLQPELEKLTQDLKVLRDEILVKLHLASMDARDRWEQDLEPRLRDFEHQAAAAGHQAADMLGHLAQDLETALRDLRDHMH